MEMEVKMALVEVQNLDAGYGAMEVLHQVSIKLNSAKIATIIGPNGAGKSTLLKAIFGLLKPSRGQVLFNGHQIGGWSPERIVRLGLSYIPQAKNVFRELTVAENLKLGRLTTQQPASDQELAELFPVLQTKNNHLVKNLSGGEQKMVALARGLAAQPEAILLDEPTSGLAPNLVQEVLNKLQQINEEQKTAMLIVEQNAQQALQSSDRGYVMAGGRIQYQDSGQKLLQNQKIKELYLGSK